MPILYDQYRLANSNQIPQYVGSTIPELTQVANVMQDRYDMGVQQSDALDYAMQNATASPFDRPELSRLIAGAKKELKSFADKGDYENTWRNVAMSAKNFAGKYKHIMENQSAISKYMSEQSDRLQKGEISKADYEANTRRIYDTYEGLKWDPSINEYTNKFSGSPLVKAPDFTEKINKILQGTHPELRGYSYRGMSADNMMEFSNGSEVKRLPWAKVKQFVESGMALDSDVQSYVKQQRELAPYNFGFTSRAPEASYRELIATTDLPVTRLAKQYAEKEGMSYKEAFQRATADIKENEIWNNVYGLAEKGVIDERSSSSSATLSGYGSAKLTAQDMAPQRFLVPSEDFRLDPKDKDIVELGKSVKSIESDIATLSSKLADPRTPANEKSDITRMIMSKSDELANKHAIINGTVNETARTLGYKGSDDMFAKLIPENKSIAYLDEKGNKSTGGISRTELIDAIKLGSVDIVSGDLKTALGGSVVVRVPGKGTVALDQFGAGNQKTDVNMKMPKGMEWVMPKGVTTAVPLWQQFVTNYKEITKNNAENYAFKPVNMTLTDQEAKDLKRTIQASPTAVQWFKPGSQKATSSIPEDFDINSIKILRKDGKYYLQANEMEHVKGGGRTPTGDIYILEIGPNSNIGNVIAQNVLGSGKKAVDPDMARAAAELAGYTFNGDILNLQRHGEFVVRDANNEVFAKVTNNPRQATTGQKYALMDKDGNLLKARDGSYLESSNVDDLSQWIQSMISNSLKTP